MVLVTRPRPGADATAARIAAMGLIPVVAPLLEIQTTRVRLPPASGVAAVLLASGNAIAALPPAFRSRPVLAVGAATARRAQAAGFKDTVSADGDAAALVALVRSRFSPADGTLLLAAGKAQSLTLAGSLRMWGYRVERRVVYAAMPVPALPEAAIGLLRGLVSAAVTRHGLAGAGLGAADDGEEPGATGVRYCPTSPGGTAPDGPVEPGHDERAGHDEGAGRDEAPGRDSEGTGRDSARAGRKKAEPGGDTAWTGQREHRPPSSCAVLFFSAETARCFMRLVRAAGLENALPHCEAVTIGRPAAMALTEGGWSRVRVARRPNQDEMLALLR